MLEGLGKTRTLVLQTIQQNPGLTKSELKQRTGLGWGTVSHHAYKLQRANVVSVQGQGTRVFLFPRGMDGTSVLRERSLRDHTHRQALDFLRTRESSSIRVVATTLGFSRKVAARILAELVDAGMAKRLGPAPSGFAVVQPPQPATPAAHHALSMQAIPGDRPVQA